MSSAVDVLLRWQEAGSVWRVIGRDHDEVHDADAVTVGLYRCDGGEEVDRLVSTDSRLRDWLADRRSSEDPTPDSSAHPAPARSSRDRDPDGRVRQARPRDALGRPLPYGSPGVEPFDERPLSPREALDVAREYLRKGRAFAAHEVLEGQWKAGPTDERPLWQGLAQLCVSITHAKRGNLVGARTVLDRSTLNLRSYARHSGPAYGLDLEAILTTIDAEHPPDDLTWLDALVT